MHDSNSTLGSDRRSFLKATSATLGGLTVTGRAAAQSEWRYELVSEALDAGTHEAVVQDDWAYSANGAAIATVDVSDPTAPLPGGTATGHGTDNADVKVDGDLAALANDGDPPGVTFYDVSDPATPTELSFYEAASGVHNCFLDGDHAYLCINDDFAYARMVIVDVSDPANPTSLEGDERGAGGAWMLGNAHLGMAEAGINPIHDLYVQDDLAYMCFWDAGVVVADVSDPTDPTAVAHFGATDRAGEKPDGTVELYERYLGSPGNTHYVQPTPDGDYTLVGAETFPVRSRTRSSRAGTGHPHLRHKRRVRGFDAVEPPGGPRRLHLCNPTGPATRSGRATTSTSARTKCSPASTRVACAPIASRTRRNRRS